MIESYSAIIRWNGYGFSCQDVDQKALGEWVGRMIAALTATSMLSPTTLCKVEYSQGCVV